MKIMRRPIKAASTSPAKDEARKFPKFLGDTEEWLEREIRFGLNGTQFYDNNYIIEFEMIPTYDGKELSEYIILKYDYNEPDKYAVVLMYNGNEDIVGYGDSLDDPAMVEVLRNELYAICDRFLTDKVNNS